MFRRAKVCAALLVNDASGHTKRTTPAVLLSLRHSPYKPSFPPASATPKPRSYFFATCNCKGQALLPRRSRQHINQKSAFHRSG